MSGGCCVRRAAQCPLPLRREAPTRESEVRELNLSTASGPGDLGAGAGKRGSRPDPGFRFSRDSEVLLGQGAGTGWSGWKAGTWAIPACSQRAHRGMCVGVQPLRSLERGCAFTPESQRDRTVTQPWSVHQERGSAVSASVPPVDSEIWIFHTCLLGTYWVPRTGVAQDTAANKHGTEGCFL